MKTNFTLFVMLFFILSFSQTTIKGKITDNTGQPLPGANIIIVGTTTGTVSDFDGNYILTTRSSPSFYNSSLIYWISNSNSEVISKNQTIDFTLEEGNELEK